MRTQGLSGNHLQVATKLNGLIDLSVSDFLGVKNQAPVALADAGADFIAVSGAVWNGDEVAAVKAFHTALGHTG